MLNNTFHARCKECGCNVTINGSNPKHELKARVEASFFVDSAHEILTGEESYDDQPRLDFIWDAVEDKLTDNMCITLICPVCGAEYRLDEFTNMTQEE